MHVVTRGVDEAVIIGETIVRVVEIKGDQVRLAISSPHGKPRYREVTLRCEAHHGPFSIGLPELLSTR